MASISCALVFFLAQLHTLLSTSRAHQGDAHNLTNLITVPFLCHPDQAKALLKFKRSFSFVESTTRLLSWQDGTDCCLWEGVACDASSGNVTVLDLSNRGLSGYGLDPSVFSITSLRRLDLSTNDFRGGNISATGFERFTFLTHLNLSNSGLYGQIPIGISKLVSLVSLDLSNYNDYYDHYSFTNINYGHNNLQGSSFDTLVENLTNLRELCLDWVDLSLSGEEWGTSLATSTPHIQVLSLAGCRLRGHIPKSLLRLGSLVVVNLQGNDGIAAGPFPEVFMDLLNLTVLQLSGINLEGWFPSRWFQSKKLRVLDLSDNQDLSGFFPNFSNASSLEVLRLDGTNFSYARSMPSSNFKSLKELSLDGNLPVAFLSSFGRLGYLCQLDLTLDSVSELGSIFSWIGRHQNLTSLVLSGCNFSEVTPTLLSNLKTLRRLTMLNCNLPRPVLHAVGNLIGLQTLDMESCTTYGSMPSSIGNLTSLRNIYLANSGFSGPMPAAIGNLANLRSMDISGGGFSGPMPAAIGKLTNLRNMYISDSGFSGPLPAAIGNLTNLEAMYIDAQNFGSSIPHTIGQLSEMEQLVLRNSNFTGSIPTSVANLTKLTVLELSLNSLSGEIPSSVFSLPGLRSLELYFNQLSGPLHGIDVAASQLETLDLSDNALSGFFPEAVFQLTSLVHIDVSSNNLVGSVDLSHFWRLSELTHLYLSYNELHVMDAGGNNPLATYLAGLDELGLGSCNITRFPRFLRRLNYISYLDLSSNKISGDVPNWIWETWSSTLTNLNLSHNMLTGVQLTSDVLPFTTRMEMLDLSYNRLSGRIPMPNSSADILDYSNNIFNSVPPNWGFYVRDTHYLSMSKNNISGHVPLSLCNSTLDFIDLSYNKFSGPIPSCLMEYVWLTVLNLRDNHFEGTLPTNITTKCTLETIDLHGNKIEGQLPRGLSNCSSLEVLDLGGNRIADTFPFWLSGLPDLSVLILRSNQLYGTIDDIVRDPKSNECFPSLQIIDLASNNLSGSLRPHWFKLLKSMTAKFNNSGETISPRHLSVSDISYEDYTEIAYKGTYMPFERILTTLTAIDFSNNRLEGTIPESIGELVSLRIFNMSHNAFTGKIPAQLGSMTALESLDLSCNQLSGEIPQELTNLTFLEVLNLSNNYLVGKIPQSLQFSTFNSSSFEGNEGLCGPPMSNLPCGASPYAPNAEHVDKSSHPVDVAMFLFVGLGFGVGFAAAIVVKWNQVGRWFIATARALWS